MEEWIESKGIEREILLVLNKKAKSLTEICKKLKKPMQTINTTINRMVDKKLIEKNKDYSGDARKYNIQILKDNVKIKRFSSFYFWFFTISILFFSPLFIYNICHKDFKNLFFGMLYFVFSNGYMFLNSFVDKDKIMVEKLVYNV